MAFGFSFDELIIIGLRTARTLFTKVMEYAMNLITHKRKMKKVHEQLLVDNAMIRNRIVKKSQI